MNHEIIGATIILTIGVLDMLAQQKANMNYCKMNVCLNIS